MKTTTATTTAKEKKKNRRTGKRMNAYENLMTNRENNHDATMIKTRSPKTKN